MSNLRISHESLGVDDLIEDLNSAKNDQHTTEPDEVAV